MKFKMKRSIEKICGNSEIIPNFEEIENSPNFVFTPDPNYETITLFDIEGNIVNLNSWLECAFYVRGGWTNNISDFIDGEKILFLFLLSIPIIYKFITKRSFKREKIKNN